MSQSSRYARGTRHLLSGVDDLEPLSRRLLQVAGALSLLLILVVVNSLLNSGSESPFNPNPVAAAAEQTQEVPGMRISLEMRISTEAEPPVTITGEGAYNGDSRLTTFAYEADSDEGTVNFDAVLSDNAWYFRYPWLGAQMPEGKEWMKVEAMFRQTEESSVSTENPESTLQILSAAGDVKRVGKATVRKVQTTRYRATLSGAGVVQSLRSQGQDELADQFEAASSQLVGPVQSEVFIDRGGMLRRIHTRTTLLAEGTPVTTDIWMDLFAFGVAPEIQVPDDSQVFELPAKLEEQLSAGELS